jgi:hypothetical protein
MEVGVPCLRAVQKQVRARELVGCRMRGVQRLRQIESKEGVALILTELSGVVGQWRTLRHPHKKQNKQPTCRARIKRGVRCW